MAASPCALALRVPKSQFVSVLQSIRNAILDWALKLEEDGILGDGVTFSSEEKQIAAARQYHLVIHGDNNQIQISGDASVQIQDTEVDLNQIADLTKKIGEAVRDSSMDDSDKSQVESDIKAIEAQIAAPAPNRSIIGEGLKSLRNVLEGAAASTLSRPDLLTGLADILSRFEA